MLRAGPEGLIGFNPQDEERGQAPNHLGPSSYSEGIVYLLSSPPISKASNCLVNRIIASTVLNHHHHTIFGHFSSAFNSLQVVILLRQRLLMVGQ